jgi:lipopolysaccharide/colanic/teichoic acid biosynthesis glycosyltransferase
MTPCPPAGLAYRVGKRALDVVVAASAIILGAPLGALIAAAIRITSSGPILFSQVRLGEQGERFTIYKFRTLPPEPAHISDLRWIDTEPAEAGPLGCFLRRTGLDEWPQFWNVLRGEMSVVGPRPERPRLASGFRRQFTGYQLRQRLKPGITGWAQVHGLRGFTDIGERLAFDLYYLENWSLWLDCKILLLTPLSALRAPRPTATLKDHAGSF